MDSRMIDVVIGLVLVFALTSLAVTMLHESLVSVDKARGRNLEVAVRSLLSEDHLKDGLADSLLLHPLIVSLADAPRVGKGKPSYIGADVFVSALLSQLAKMYSAGRRPDTPEAFVAAVRLGSTALLARAPSPAFVDNLALLLEGVEGDWDAYIKRLMSWYDAVGERSTGWFKRATQMRLFWIGLLLAAAANVNPFVIAPRLWNDDAMRTAAVQMAERAAENYGSDAKVASRPAADVLNDLVAAMRAPAGARPDPAGAMASMQAEFDLSFKALQEDLESILKARRGTAVVFDQLGKAIGLLGEIDRFAKLRRSAAPAGDRQALLDYGESIKDHVARLGVVIEGLLPSVESNTDLSKWHRQLAAAALREGQRLAPGSRTEGAARCLVLADAELRRQCEAVVSAATGLTQLGLPVGWTFANLPDCEHGPCVLDAIRADAAEKTRVPDASATSTAATPDLAPVAALPAGTETWSALKRCSHDFSCASISLLGWIATALATMLGAPFWFDALGKLIKIRGAGKRLNGDNSAEGRTGTGAGDSAATSGVLATSLSTPLPVGGVAMRDVQTSAEARLSPVQVLELQSGSLRSFGAQASGFFDEAMRKAITDWQVSIGENATGELTQTQIDRLLAPVGSVPASDAAGSEHEHLDGCDVEITSAVPDENLPASQGGVAPP